MKFKVNLPQIKLNQWVAALESGDYAQGKHTLCAARADGDEFKPMSEFKEDHDYGGAPAATEFQFCCLGVLAEVMGVNRFEIEGQILDDLVTTYPMCPSMWLGTYETSDDPDQDTDENNRTLQFTLAQMNDGALAGVYPPTEPKSFAEIAQWIREHVEGAE